MNLAFLGFCHFPILNMLKLSVLNLILDTESIIGMKVAASTSLIEPVDLVDALESLDSFNNFARGSALHA